MKILNIQRKMKFEKDPDEDQRWNAGKTPVRFFNNFEIPIIITSNDENDINEDFEKAISNFLNMGDEERAKTLPYVYKNYRDFVKAVGGDDEFDFKVEQIEDIKLELERLEKKEALQQKIQTEQQAIDVIKQELDVIGDPDESKKVFHTVNTVVDLLKSKNQITESELNSVKEEFRELKNKYAELMSKLK